MSSTSVGRPLSAESVLEGILADIKPSTLTDAQVLKLAFVLPQELVLQALEIVDLGQVLSPFATTSHGFLQVASLSNPAKPYTLHLPPHLDRSHTLAPKTYCSCPAWAFNLHKITLARAKKQARGPPTKEPGQTSILICKHVLAARLAISLGKVRSRPASAAGDLWSGVG